MDLYFLRHGIAVAPGTPGYKDSQRPLTEEGIEAMKLEAKGMKNLDLEFDQILSSPYVRAVQTAEIVVKGLGFKKKLQFTDALISEENPKKLVQELSKKFPLDAKILLVGHEPFMSQLISILTGDGRASIDLKKGGLCRLSLTSLTFGRCATLKWLLTPKQLMRLA